MNTIENENSVYGLTRRAIEESEARVAALEREIELLHEIIAQNRSFLERIEKSSRSSGGAGTAAFDRVGANWKPPAAARKIAPNGAPVSRPDDKRLRGGQTYAASILAVLSENPNGFTTAELTEYFRKVRHPISTRDDVGKAVSNQLSQLKGKHLVVRDKSKRFTLAGA
jgi:hypothetical protein